MPRLHAELMDTLLAPIADGTYPVGAMLPKEELLAAELDVSRGVVRECIRALEERGVVRVRHGRGATVLPARAWNVLDPQVFAAVRGAAGGRRLVSEALEARAIVQGETAALAAERSRPEAVAALTAAVEAIETAPDAGLPAAELQFDRVLAEAAGIARWPASPSPWRPGSGMSGPAGRLPPRPGRDRRRRPGRRPSRDPA